MAMCGPYPLTISIDEFHDDLEGGGYSPLVHVNESACDLKLYLPLKNNIEVV